MNYIEIDRLKSIFSDMQRNQYTIRCMAYGIDGNLIAIGYNPYWTNRYDSKIEKLELSFLGKTGIMVPLVLKNIVDYNVYPKADKRNKKYKMNMIELMVLSPKIGPDFSRNNEKDLYEKVQFEIVYDD